MSTFPGSPNILKGALVLVDPESAQVQRVITLQYNPDSLSRTLQIQGLGQSGDRTQALRLTGPPVESLKIDAEIDATDQLETADSTTVESGINPQLSALETIVYPTNSQIQTNIGIANAGTLEIIPAESPLTLFVWSKSRVIPVRITEFSITEEAFDVNLNPIRAKVSLGMRVLSVNDLPDEHKGSGLFMAYHQQKENLAGKSKSGRLGRSGISSI